MTNIVFVDENDNPIGAGTKQEAVRNRIVHRVIRIFLSNSKGELLLQKRADDLQSNPGKWDQSVGGHVDEGEEYIDAALREMREELGIEGIRLQEMGTFFRDAEDGHEGKRRFNTLYTGAYDGPINFNPEEISEVKWIAPVALAEWMNDKPHDFTDGAKWAFRQLYLDAV